MAVATDAKERIAADAAPFQQDQKLKEAYFTASQGQLIWSRFKSQPLGNDRRLGAHHHDR